MTKEQLERALDEVDMQRQILITELRKFQSEEMHDEETQGDFPKGDTDFDKESDNNFGEEETNRGPKTMATATKNIVKKAVVSGNLKDTMGKVSGALDFAKVGVNSFCEILDKAQEKLDGNIEELPGPMGIPIMTDMWIPMLLGLMQTQEFQHLMSNMLVQIIKD